MLRDIKNRLSRYSSEYSIESKHTSSSSLDRSVQDREKPQRMMPRFNTGRSTSQSSLSISASTPSSQSTSPRPMSPSSPIPRIQSVAGSLMSCGSDQLLDHSHLKPGDNAELLSYTKTIDMYRENAKKIKDTTYQSDFAVFLVEAASRLQQKHEEHGDFDISSYDEESISFTDVKKETDPLSRKYLDEAEKLLKQVAHQGHVDSQYYLASMHAAGLLSKDGQEDYEKAFPFFVQAAKNHHADAAYRTAQCYENKHNGRRNKGKAVQYYRKAANSNHPGAMYSLGTAYLHGKLGLTRNVRNAHKWLKRSAERATEVYPHALHSLALLHEKGVDSIILPDHAHAIKMLETAAVKLQYGPSATRLGEIYELGKLSCKPDPNLSLWYYELAAELGDPEGCLGVAAWCLTGIEGGPGPSDEFAFEWAMRAAQAGLAKAEFAVGYFCENGIGKEANLDHAMEWYKRAAKQGEKKAIDRLENSGHAGVHASPSAFNLLQKKAKGFLGTRPLVTA